MKHKDTDKMDTFNSDLHENNKEPYSIWKKDRNVKSRAKTPKMSQKIPLSRFGIGFLILMILMILLFSKNQNALLENRIVALENRIKDVQETVDRMDAVDERVAQIWEKAGTVEQFKERLDRSEAALTSKMNQIVKEQNRLQKQMAQVRINTTKSSKTEKVSKKPTEVAITSLSRVKHCTKSDVNMV